MSVQCWISVCWTFFRVQGLFLATCNFFHLVMCLALKGRARARFLANLFHGLGRSCYYVNYFNQVLLTLFLLLRPLPRNLMKTWFSSRLRFSTKKRTFMHQFFLILIRQQQSILCWRFPQCMLLPKQQYHAFLRHFLRGFCRSN